jgi:hypothetical protein
MNPLLSDFFAPANPPADTSTALVAASKKRTGLALTVAYVTCRIRPRFDWFCASLAREIRQTRGIQPENLQIVVVDSRLWYDENRAKEMADIAAKYGLIIEHRAPKPSPWQGPQRQTSQDYFCAVNARNTALAYTQATHVAFADDVGVLLPGWLSAHLAALDGGYALVGTTCKVTGLDVADDGTIRHYRMAHKGEDSRIHQMKSSLHPCPGNWLYGGTFSVPMRFALAVNGKDEAYMGINGADYDFGFRLEYAGCKFFATRAGRYEGKEIAPGEAVEPRAAHCNKAWKGPDGPHTNDFLLKDIQRTRRHWTRGNDYSLRDVRERVLKFGEAGFPPVQPNTVHWIDKQPLSEM